MKSVATLRQLPPDCGMEIAFIGRSNAGKSSALNKLTANHKLAKTSKTPGCTRLLNFFMLDTKRRLVDLPGYGYAKASRFEKARYQKLISAYWYKRQSLQGLVLLMDSRHPLKIHDQQMINLAIRHGVFLHILLTKSDKLSQMVAKRTLHHVHCALGNRVSVQLFSATTGKGLDTLQTKLHQWLKA